MIFLRRSVFICKLLLIALLTSVFATASANNFTYTNIAGRSASTMKTPALDCQSASRTKNNLKHKLACHLLTEPIVSNVKTVDSCCCSINVLTLFPATRLAELKKRLLPSLVLIRKKQTVKTHAFTELIYRPPIG
jgi:hypothetical protein